MTGGKIKQIHIRFYGKIAKNNARGDRFIHEIYFSHHKPFDRCENPS